MLKTTLDTLRDKLNNLKSADLFLPERCKQMEEIVLDLLNEVETVQKKIEKIQRVLGD